MNDKVYLYLPKYNILARIFFYIQTNIIEIKHRWANDR